MATQNAIGSSINQDGRINQTVHMQNTAQGKNQLVMTISNSGGTDATDLPIIPGCDKVLLGRGSTTGVTYALRNWADKETFWDYAKNIGAVVDGVEVSTTDTDNFLSGNALVQYQTYFTGKKSDEVETFFEDYKVDNGGGSYNPSFKISGDDFSPVVKTLLSLKLKSLKAGSSITFKFNVSLQEMSVNASALEAIKL